MKISLVILILLSGAALAADVPELPTLPPSPISEFRKMLTMSPEQRTMALARRSPQSRQTLQSKIVEYNAYSKEERDRRLNASEFRWYLRTLMKTPRAIRLPMIQSAPENVRGVIEERLNVWDNMDTNIQQRILDNEFTVQYLSSPAPEAVVISMNAEEKKQLEERVALWKGLPEWEQKRLQNYLHEFFNLPADEQTKAFNAAEREDMARTLRAFRDLPNQQREQCIAAFGQFAAMSQGERVAFLHNVSRWQAMSPQDRDTWRNLVKSLPPMPPLPPGFFKEPPLPIIE